jgi:hypothetical protein
MTTLLLSFLLILLVGIGLLMAAPRALEHFVDAPATTTVQMSPTMAALVTPRLGPAAAPPPQVDSLAREKDAVAAASAVPSTSCPECPACPTCPTCPKCPTCADMTQYIRMDEIPCWNCTLP